MTMLAMPRFGTQEAISGEKLDEVLQALAARLNGGLDAKSLAPATNFALSQFWEQYSLCPVTIQIGVALNLASVIVPIAGYFLGCSIAPQVQGADERSFSVTKNPGAVALITNPPLIVGDSMRQRRFVYLPDAPVALAAGDRLDAVLNGYSSLPAPDWTITLLLAFSHQA